MPIPLDAPEVLDREFLLVRAKLLEIAASLDRIGRAEGQVEGDRRLQLIHDALDVLRQGESDRAEQIQMICSLSYDEQWQEKFDLLPR
ncbi:MAG: hypothetical protein IID44_17785 [Planctomycetes bacterium]|nr:hypothetical protein [Planctomycetota bacterium]